MTPGQVAYEAYCGRSGGVSLVTGQQLPAWDDQAADIREAWEAGAQAVAAIMRAGPAAQERDPAGTEYRRNTSPSGSVLPDMNAAARLAVTAAAVLALAGCAPAGSPSVTTLSPPPGSQAASPPPVTGQPVLRHVHDPGTVTGTLAGPCHERGTVPDELPDPRCTPGAVDPSVTATVLCSGSYRTSRYRPPAEATDRFKYDDAYPAYGISAGTRTELDHLVSLELGGANDASNLWPEAPPSPNLKDKAEGQLHSWVCAVSGTAAQDRLIRAQQAIAADWLTAERVLGITR